MQNRNEQIWKISILQLGVHLSRQVVPGVRAICYVIPVETSRIPTSIADILILQRCQRIRPHRCKSLSLALSVSSEVQFRSEKFQSRSVVHNKERESDAQH